VGRADAGTDERVELVGLELAAQLVERALDETEVNRADDPAVRVGDLAEGAVLHEERVAVLGGLEAGLEAELVEKSGSPSCSTAG
jgi:hypothetical protein